MLKGKTAIVTGGGRGIGRAIALKLAENGANVAVIYAGDAAGAARQVADRAGALGVRAVALQCDVADFAACKAAVAAVTEALGPVDILVDNADSRDGLVYSMSEESFSQVVDTNLKGAFNMARHCCGTFIRKKRGRVINISSVSGLMGNAGQVNYSASKAGLIGLTKSLARELAGRGVCVNAIAPGFIETEMTAELPPGAALADAIPMRRMGRAEEVADLALFLASDLAGYITGEVIRVDGGLAM